MLSATEENYLKALFNNTQERPDAGLGTNELASILNVKPSSVNDMLKRLKEKQFINYEKYSKATLTQLGEEFAVQVVRKHRLWETFLCDKLKFSWDEVHEVAEQLEHIQSTQLINRLDEFLGFPSFDPHGDVIPDAKGHLKEQNRMLLSQFPINTIGQVAAVRDSMPEFLHYVEKIGIMLNIELKIISRQPFDGSMEILLNGTTHMVSAKFGDNIWMVQNVEN